MFIDKTSIKMKYTYALLALNSLFLVGLQPQIASASTLSTVLYDSSGLPEDDTPRWLAPGAIDSNGFPITDINSFQTVDSTTNAFTLQTNNIDSSSDTAGYLGYSNYTAVANTDTPNPFDVKLELVNPAFPVLNADDSYSVFFEVGVNPFEVNSTDRGSFSIVAISSDISKGIELDFDENTIFAQSDVDNGSGFSQFTRAEEFNSGSTIDLSQLNSYELKINSSTYQLFANGDTSAILTGNLRDYEFSTVLTNPPLPFNPYETENFLFFGDLTDRAAGSFTLGEVRVETATASTPEFDFTLALSLIGVGMIGKRIFKK